MPARYVKGVVVRPESQIAAHYVVRESDAHAWVDAYIEGRGWVEEDPTPPGDYAAVHAEPPPGAIEEAWEAVRARAAVLWAGLRQGGWPRFSAWIADAARKAWTALRRQPALAVALAVLLALLAAGFRARASIVRWWASRRRRMAARGREESVVPTQLRALLNQVERHWARHGHPRPETSGLREHLEALPREALAPSARAASARVVDSYYRASFGQEPPSEQDLAELSAQVASLP